MALKAVARRAHVVLTIAESSADRYAFVADRIYDVEAVIESHGSAGTDVGAVTLDVKKCTGTTALSSGTSILSSTFNLKSSNNVPVSKTKANGGVVTTGASRLAVGDRLALDYTGTVTAYGGAIVTIVLTPVIG